MKLLQGYLILALALLISGVAAYFSVVGLAAIFSATFWAVVIMGCSLEAGKLVSAWWLHDNWWNAKVNKLHKTYMTAAVVVLMLITALGIYGFLAKGHLAQEAQGAPVALQIAQRESRIQQLQTEIDRQNARQTQMDAAVNGVIADNATRGLRARRGQAAERREIKNEIDAATAEINKLTEELVPLKLESGAVEAKLGPIKYVAPLFGQKDTEGAVRIVILMLMFAFDPLAVVMMLSATITLGEAYGKKIKLEPTKHEVSEGAGLGEILEPEEGRKRLREYAEGGEPVELKSSILPEFHLDVPMPPVKPPQDQEENQRRLDEARANQTDDEMWAEEQASPAYARLIAAAAEAEKGNFGENVSDLDDDEFIARLSHPEALSVAEFEKVSTPAHPFFDADTTADPLTENLLQQLEEEVAQKDDKELLLEILERKPELLQVVIESVTEEVIDEVIEAVNERKQATDEQNSASVAQKGWIDEKWTPPPAK